MKKIIVVIGVVLVLAGISFPFVSGFVMERIVRDSFDNLNQRYAEAGHDVRAEIVRYDRGFHSSEIEWRIKSENMKALHGIGEVIFVDRAEHNLSGITTRTSLERNGWYADFVNGRLGGKDPLHITTTYKITGGIETAAIIEAFAVQEGQETATVKPGNIAVAFDKEFKSFSADGYWGGMEVDGKFALAGITLKSDLTMISPYIWDGKIHMAMQSSKAKGESDGDRLELSGLKLDSVIDFDHEGKTLAATAEYGVDSILAGMEKIGDISARFGVTGLNADRYEEFMKTYTATMRDLFSKMAIAKNDPQKMKEIVDREMANVGFELVAAGEKLLTKGLEFQLTGLHLQVPEGEINGDVVMGLKKDMSFAQFIPMVNQPRLALEILELKSAVSLPANLVGDAPLLFSPVYPGMQTGLFLEEGDIVRHKAETKDGKLFLNEKEVLWQ